MIKKVLLYNIFKTDSLRTRDAAQKIIKKISKSKSYQIIIDFKNINFASRSFLHELITNIKNYKDTKFINTNEEIDLMLKLVKMPKPEIIAKFNIEKPITIQV